MKREPLTKYVLASFLTVVFCTVCVGSDYCYMIESASRHLDYHFSCSLDGIQAQVFQTELGNGRFPKKHSLRIWYDYRTSKRVIEDVGLRYEKFWGAITNSLYDMGVDEETKTGVVGRVWCMKSAGKDVGKIEKSVPIPLVSAFTARLARELPQGLADGCGGSRNRVFYCQQVENPEIPLQVSLLDLYLTMLRFMRCTVSCRGILKNSSDGEGELWVDWTNETVSPQDIASLSGGRRIVFRLQFRDDDDTQLKLKQLENHSVTVKGNISVNGEELSNPLEFLSDGHFLQDCSIVEDAGEVRGIVGFPKVRYTSPCEEFKFRFEEPSGNGWIVHFYGARLFLVHKIGHRVVSSQRVSLFNEKWEVVREERLWMLIKEVEALIPRRHPKGEFYSDGMAMARVFSEIKEVDLSGKNTKAINDLLEKICTLLQEVNCKYSEPLSRPELNARSLSEDGGLWYNTPP